MPAAPSRSIAEPTQGCVIFLWLLHHGLESYSAAWCSRVLDSNLGLCADQALPHKALTCNVTYLSVLKPCRPCRHLVGCSVCIRASLQGALLFTEHYGLRRCVRVTGRLCRKPHPPRSNHASAWGAAFWAARRLAAFAATISCMRSAATPRLWATCMIASSRENGYMTSCRCQA